MHALCEGLFTWFVVVLKGHWQASWTYGLHIGGCDIPNTNVRTY